MPSLCMLQCRAWIHELSFFDLEGVDDDIHVPRFEMVAYLEKCSRVISSSHPPTTNRQQEERSFVSDPVTFLSNAQSDAAATEVLSFSLHDSWPQSFVLEISSYAREVVESVELSGTTNLRVEIRIHCKVDYVDDEYWMEISLEDRRRMAVEAKLGETEWTEINDEDNDDEEKEKCPVCLVEFTEGEMLAETPCSHYFHKECVMNWLVERSDSCPLCRCEVVHESEYEMGLILLSCKNC